MYIFFHRIGQLVSCIEQSSFENHREHKREDIIDIYPKNVRKGKKMRFGKIIFVDYNGCVCKWLIG